MTSKNDQFEPDDTFPNDNSITGNIPLTHNFKNRSLNEGEMNIENN